MDSRSSTERDRNFSPGGFDGGWSGSGLGERLILRDAYCKQMKVVGGEVVGDEGR